MSRILVTGGAGYIGSHVVDLLLKGGHEVVVLDSFLYGDKGIQSWRSHPNVTIQKGDICDIRDVVKAIKGCSTVIALAAIVGDPACDLDHDETMSANYEATKVLAEVAKYHKVKRIVFASSCSVYGENSSCFLNEGSRLNPVSLYAETRIMSENVLLRHQYDLEIVILRLASVFGVSDRMRFDLAVNILSAKAFYNNEIQIMGRNQHRPFIHVQDAARSFMLASLAPTDLVKSQIFNVGSNDLNFKIEEIGQKISRIYSNLKVHYGEMDDLRNYRVDFSKIQSLLDFQTRFTLEDGIGELKEYFQRNPDLRYLDDIYYNVKYLFKDGK